MVVLRRLLSTVAPASALVFGSGYYFRDELRSYAATLVADPTSQRFTDVAAALNDPYAPLSRWNKNWDNREPSALIDQAKYAAANEEERAAMLKKVQPTSSRNVILIRHGQYQFHTDKQPLTELGREQALLLGKRLALSKIKFDKVVMSTMTRANETAQIILTQLDKNVSVVSDSMLEEGAPYPPEPPHSDWRPRVNEFFTDGSRIEAAFRKYIHRASPKQTEDSYEVIVCHANVIRYFICRALQFPPEGWLRLSLGHTSITMLTIRPNGYVTLRSCGDVGHLPQAYIYILNFKQKTTRTPYFVT